jgi:hypothetical protein
MASVRGFFRQMARFTPAPRVRALWSVATLFLVSIALAASWVCISVVRRPPLLWLFRHPAVLREQQFGGPSCESFYWVDAFSRSSMCLAVVLFMSSHLALRFLRPRRIAPISALRFRDGLGYRAPAPAERVIVNLDALRAASAARADLARVWAVALSLGIALIGCSRMWSSALVGHCCGACGNSCFRSGNPAEYLAYYSLAVVCILSHASRSPVQLQLSPVVEGLRHDVRQSSPVRGELRDDGEESSHRLKESRDDGDESSHRLKESRDDGEESSHRLKESRDDVEESRDHREESRDDVEESRDHREELRDDVEESRDHREESRDDVEESSHGVRDSSQ